MLRLQFRKSTHTVEPWRALVSASFFLQQIHSEKEALIVMKVAHSLITMLITDIHLIDLT
jgi:hypothetical protein